MVREARSAARGGYMQPTEASWREFMERRGWVPADLEELPDDWLYGEWGRYQLQIKFGML